MNDLRFIALTGKHGNGKYAVVDECDFDRVRSAFSWRMDTRGYVLSTVNNGMTKKLINGKIRSRAIAKTVWLHREIFGVFVWHKDCEVDHENHTVIDCTRRNLRIATILQNRVNRLRHKNNSCPYKGVSEVSGVFYPRIGTTIEGVKKLQYLGTFRTAEDAARAYDRAAIKKWGEFAHTNFPRSDYEVQS